MIAFVTKCLVMCSLLSVIFIGKTGMLYILSVNNLGITPISYLVVVVVVAFSSHARIFGDCSRINFLPALFFFFLSGDYLAQTNFTLSARISPQWLSKLRQL